MKAPCLSHRACLRCFTLWSLVLTLSLPVAASAGFEGKIQNRKVRADASAIERVVANTKSSGNSGLVSVPPQRFVDDGGDGIRVETGTLTVKGAWGRAESREADSAAGSGVFVLMNFENGDAFACRAERQRCTKTTRAEREAARDHAAEIRKAVRGVMKDAGLLGTGAGGAAGDSDLGVEATQRASQVAGTSVTEYRISERERVAAAWIALSLPELASLYKDTLEVFELSGRDLGFTGRARSAAAEHGLPMRVVIVEPQRGAAVYRASEILGFENTAVEPAYVQPPAGWTIESAREQLEKGAHSPAAR